MFEKNANARPKFETSVRVSMSDGDQFDAYVFLRVDERLIDLLNDPRAFIPVKKKDGATAIIAKTNIVSIIESDWAYPTAQGYEPEFETELEGIEASPEAEMEAEQAAEDDREKADADAKEEKEKSRKKEKAKKPESQPKKKADPYEILKTSKTASLDEIRAAYKARIKIVHPDTLSGLDVDEEILRAAIHETQRVNRAYRAIMRERAEEDVVEERAEAS